MVDILEPVKDVVKGAFKPLKEDKRPEPTGADPTDALRIKCVAKGGKWDAENKKCIMPDLLESIPNRTEGGTPAPTDRNITFNPDKTVTITGADQQPVTLTKEEYDVYLGKPGELTENVKQAQAQPNIQEFESEQLSQQLGQAGQLPVSPTGLNVGEAVTTGLVQAIPRALTIAGGAAVAGATAGLVTTGGAASVPLAVLGAAVGFVGSISSSMIGNFKSQRTDTTTAQQRVLDEGKQNLNDWATLAATDVANRATYVARFNQQLALIDQAYRQMKLDTSRDVAKFETALPNLAEFESFYNLQGEKDFLVARMRQALGAQQDPEYIYQLAELAERRSK